MADSSIKKHYSTQGLRKINLRTDMSGLVDLLEIVFYDSMDQSDRVALHDMRAMSNMGVVLSWFGRFNELVLGVSQGFVWIEEGRLVGNVSIFPAHWPLELGGAWQIVNVGVHPDYQRQGIARKLMQASLDAIRQKGGKHAILQVDYENEPAIQLYETLGFIKERAFTTWKRPAITHTPPPLKVDDVHVSYPHADDWQQELALAQALRPNQRGGIGWQRPLHPQEFKPSFWKRLGSLFSMNTKEHLIIRDGDEREIVAILLIERGLNLVSTKLTLIVRPDYHAPRANILLTSALRRFHRSSFVIEHPHDDDLTNDLLNDLRFLKQRTRWHMRWTEPNFAWSNLQ